METPDNLLDIVMPADQYQPSNWHRNILLWETRPIYLFIHMESRAYGNLISWQYKPKLNLYKIIMLYQSIDEVNCEVSKI